MKKSLLFLCLAALMVGAVYWQGGISLDPSSSSLSSSVLSPAGASSLSCDAVDSSLADETKRREDTNQEITTLTTEIQRLARKRVTLQRDSSLSSSTLQAQKDALKQFQKDFFAGTRFRDPVQLDSMIAKIEYSLEPKQLLVLRKQLSVFTFRARKYQIRVRAYNKYLKEFKELRADYETQLQAKKDAITEGMRTQVTDTSSKNNEELSALIIELAEKESRKSALQALVTEAEGNLTVLAQRKGVCQQTTPTNTTITTPAEATPTGTTTTGTTGTTTTGTTETSGTTGTTSNGNSVGSSSSVTNGSATTSETTTSSLILNSAEDVTETGTTTTEVTSTTTTGTTGTSTTDTTGMTGATGTTIPASPSIGASGTTSATTNLTTSETSAAPESSTTPTTPPTGDTSVPAVVITKSTSLTASVAPVASVTPAIIPEVVPPLETRPIETVQTVSQGDTRTAVIVPTVVTPVVTSPVTITPTPTPVIASPATTSVVPVQTSPVQTQPVMPVATVPATPTAASPVTSANLESPKTPAASVTPAASSTAPVIGGLPVIPPYVDYKFYYKIPAPEGTTYVTGDQMCWFVSVPYTVNGIARHSLSMFGQALQQNSKTGFMYLDQFFIYLNRKPTSNIDQPTNILTYMGDGVGNTKNVIQTKRWINDAVASMYPQTPFWYYPEATVQDATIPSYIALRTSTAGYRAFNFDKEIMRTQGGIQFIDCVGINDPLPKF